MRTIDCTVLRLVFQPIFQSSLVLDLRDICVNLLPKPEVFGHFNPKLLNFWEILIYEKP